MAYPPPPPQPPSRPIGVAILAILVILAGVILVLISLVALLAGVAILATTGITLILVIAAVAFILSLILLLAGLGLWHLRPWAWWLAMIVIVLGIANAIAGMQLSRSTELRDLVPLALPVLILLYLFAVRHHFRSPVAYVAR